MVFVKPETIEKVLTAYKRHIPKAWYPSRIRFDRNLFYKFIKEFVALAILLFSQMFLKIVKRWKEHWSAYK